MSKSKSGKMKGKAKRELKPKLRFPEFRDARGWPERRMSQFLAESRVKGSTGDEAKKITVKLWGNGVFEKEDVVQGSVNTQYYKRSEGQFIYSKLDFLNQAFGIVPPHLDGFESTVDLPCFDVSDELNPIFLLEYVQRKGFYKKLGEMADGGRKAKRIQVDTFLSFPIFVPESETEQQKIADCLSSLDELIAAHSRKLDALKAHKKGLMQQLFPCEGETLPRLRLPEFKDAKPWKPKKLDKIATRGSGHTPSKSKPEYYNGGIKWVSLTDSKRLDNGLITETDKEISELGIKNSSAVLHPAGTVFVSRDAGVGKSAVMGEPMAVSQHFIAWTCDKEELTNWFLYYLLQRNKPLFESMAVGNTIKTIGLQFFKDWRITIPLPNEQKRIGDCFQLIDELIAAVKRKLDSLSEHKKGLMQQLFPSLESKA